MTNKNQDKLLILSLLSYQEWTSKEIAIKLNRTIRSVKVLIKELNEDIFTYLEKSQKISIDLSGNISLININPEELFHILYTLKLVYIDDTYEFKIIHLLLLHEKKSILEVAQNLFLSLSYTRRTIKKLNEFIDKYDFKIIENENFLELQGNELSIRLFLYTLMNDTYHSLNWPYLCEDMKFPSDIEKSLKIILTILKLRQSKSKTLPNLNKKCQWVIDQMKDIFNFIPDLKSQNIYCDHIFNDITTENYFIFFTHICSSYVIPREIKIKLGEIFLLKDTDVLLFSRNLAHRLLDIYTLNKPNEKYYLLVYYLTLLDCFHEIMGSTTTLFEELLFPPSQYSVVFEHSDIKEIEIFFKSVILEENRTDILMNERLQQYFYGLIHSVLKSEHPSIIYICIHCTKTLTAQDIIQTRLESIYNDKTIFFTQHKNDADLIITDCLDLNQQENSELFYFNTILKKEQWSFLLHRINLIILKKFP